MDKLQSTIDAFIATVLTSLGPVFSVVVVGLVCLGALALLQFFTGDNDG